MKYNYKNTSMKEKLDIAWNLANHLTFNDDGTVYNMEKFSNDDDGIIFNVIELLPEYINRWLEGRMSIKSLLDLTPEKMENIVDESLKSILDIYKKYNVPFPDYFVNGKLLYSSDISE